MNIPFYCSQPFNCDVPKMGTLVPLGPRKSVSFKMQHDRYFSKLCKIRHESKCTDGVITTFTKFFDHFTEYAKQYE